MPKKASEMKKTANPDADSHRIIQKANSQSTKKQKAHEKQKLTKQNAQENAYNKSNARKKGAEKSRNTQKHVKKRKKKPPPNSHSCQMETFELHRQGLEPWTP